MQQGCFSLVDNADSMLRSYIGVQPCQRLIPWLLPGLEIHSSAQLSSSLHAWEPRACGGCVCMRGGFLRACVCACTPTWPHRRPLDESRLCGQPCTHSQHLGPCGLHATRSTAMPGPFWNIHPRKAALIPTSGHAQHLQQGLCSDNFTSSAHACLHMSRAPQSNRRTDA